jgi:hypothetical protein
LIEAENCFLHIGSGRSGSSASMLCEGSHGVCRFHQRSTQALLGGG